MTEVSNSLSSLNDRTEGKFAPFSFGEELSSKMHWLAKDNEFSRYAKFPYDSQIFPEEIDFSYF